jgi:hypothetical protein
VKVEHGAAWHFASLGGVDAITDKLLAYSHTEVATPQQPRSGQNGQCVGRGT